MTYETGIVTNGDLKYNIQVRQIQDSSWQQRHIWFHDNPAGEADEWITCPRGIAERFAARNHRQEAA